MNIHIRPSSKDDLPELVKLQSLVIETLAANDLNLIQIAALVESEANARGKVSESLVVAEVDKEIVGFASLLLFTWSVGAFHIHPNWIEQGVGELLLTTLESMAISRGYCRLGVAVSGITATFFQAQGYQFQRHLEFKLRSTQYQMRPSIGVSFQRLEKRLLPTNSEPKQTKHWHWIVLLLIGVSVGISLYQSDKQDMLPDSDNYPGEQF
jgi:GNAT superfamily N-acetyltransferase